VNFEQHRQWVDSLRAIPLPEVLRATGAEADRHDPAKWHTAHGVLSVNDAKFFNWNKGCGGGGAIDLAMHLNACTYTTAVQWLTQRCVAATAPPQRPPSPQPSRLPGCLPAARQGGGQVLTLPTPAAGQLDRVLRYLYEQRRLPEALLKPLRDAGRLYADRCANAVFVLLGKEARPVGAELRGTSATAWRGLAPGSRKNLGYFACGPAHAPELVLCESAIDAISCAALYPDRLCLSTAGARPNPAWLPSLLARHHRLYCGFDADATGDQMAAAMTARHPAVQRLRPPLHDWNDVLTATA
jgi:hypothetical protein